MIPEHISITNGSVHEITEAKRNTETKECFGLVPGSILTFDRGFTDYGWFSTLDTKGILFVGRLKKNASIWVQTEVQTGNEIGVISDSTITLWDKKKTQEMTMRRVIYIAQDEQDKTKTVRYEFITNNTDLPAQTIADIYKRRWDIELFFKWIKQHLKIKSFLGTSKNAVMAQIWIAMIYYLVLAYIADTNKLTRHSLLSLQRRLDALFFERIHLFHVIHFRRKGTAEELRKILEPPNQMILF
jgi:putative transposase